MFTIGILLNLPFGYDQLMSVECKEIPFDGFWRICFVVICTTFLTYLLNIYALKRLTPTKVVIFAYMQPIIAIIYAVLSENDKLDLVKVISCIVILSGVYLVTQKTR
jgi:drug/metabolite transporter (DMT)-like permease